MTSGTRFGANAPRLVLGLRGLGAAGLLVEGAVHVQQYFQLFSGVTWIGPLFILNAVGCAVAAAGLAVRRTASLAAVLGLVISVAALAALEKSFHGGVLGWVESTMRPAIWVAIVSEAVATVALGGLLLLALAPRARFARRAPSGRGTVSPGAARAAH